MSNRLGSSLNFLWVIDFSNEKRLHHGALLRYFNLAPQMVAQGHRVTFAVNIQDSDRRPSIQYLQKLKLDGIFTDFMEANFKPPALRNRVAARLVHPALGNLILRTVRRRFAASIDAIARQVNSNVILISSSRFFFLAQESRSGCTFIYDMGDSSTLYFRRHIRFLTKKLDFVGLIKMLKPGIWAYAQERYYSRMPVTKILVSPVDKDAIDKLSGKPCFSKVVLNGVRDGVPKGQFQKIPGRIIFTGNMDFPPNYEAALWFLDNVFPLVLERRPDACFVIAGANPIPELLRRSSKNVVVTGYVENLNREIACSEIYVAPLVSGGGFKNKVVEAIVNWTSLVATSIAVEFFNSEIRDLLTVVDSPVEMANAIIHIWQDPRQAEARADKLRKAVMSRLSWAGRAAEIVEIARTAVARSQVSNLR